MKVSALDRLVAKAVEQGPCLICCQPGAFARHRTWDAIDTSIRVDGWTDLKIAREYSVKVQEVRDVREAFAEARKRKRLLPGRQAPE